MFIFYRFLCFKRSVNTHVLVLLGYQKLLKFINILVYDRLTYITHDFLFIFALSIQLIT
jgi:hypothetical protein